MDTGHIPFLDLGLCWGLGDDGGTSLAGARPADLLPKRGCHRHGACLWPVSQPHQIVTYDILGRLWGSLWLMLGFASMKRRLCGFGFFSLFLCFLILLDGLDGQRCLVGGGCNAFGLVCWDFFGSYHTSSQKRRKRLQVKGVVSLGVLDSFSKF